MDVQAALIDSAPFRLWMPYVKESRLVATNPDGSSVAYAKLDFPMVDDPDYVISVVDEEADRGRPGRVRAALEGGGRGRARAQGRGGLLAQRGHLAGDARARTRRTSSTSSAWIRWLHPDWLASFGQKDGVMDTLGAVEKRAQKLTEERKKHKPAAPKARERRPSRGGNREPPRPPCARGSPDRAPGAAC